MKGMSVVVKTVANWVVSFVFLFGLCIVAYGHLTPGGGFAGGVILACAFVLLILAHGKEHTLQSFPYGPACKLDSAGALMFLAVAAFGLVSGGRFFVNFIQRTHPGSPMRLFNAGIIPLCNLAIALKVGASLFLAVVAFSVLRVLAKGTLDDFVSEEEE